MMKIKTIKEDCSSEETRKLLHQTIKKSTDDLEELRFNTVVSQLMIFVNHLSSLDELDKKVLHQFLILLNPLAPHISEELNEKLGYRTISGFKWPTYDEQFLSEDTVTLAIQFNGKQEGRLVFCKIVRK